jgi:hypothetical protein
MEAALDTPVDAEDIPPGCPADVGPKRRKRGRSTAPQLLTRDKLDGRTKAAQVFDRLIADIESDLGGSEQLSTIERALVEGFAGACVQLYGLNTRIALGQTVDLAEHATCVSAMVKVASRLQINGRWLRPKDVSLSLSDLLRQDHAHQLTEGAS